MTSNTAVEIDEGVFESAATIDNGAFGTRTIRFETGRLAQQAAGAVVAYLDDETMLLFFRREGRPSTDAILTCRLIDRPLRPSFVDGLRNEIQVVVTVMSLNPNDLYDVVAINAASASTQLAGLPFSGPVGGVRVALITGGATGDVSGENKAGQWVAFPTVEQLENAVFDMAASSSPVTSPS